MQIDTKLLDRLYAKSEAERWGVSRERLAGALVASARKAFGDRDETARELEKYLSALHLDDLALACACADGQGEAWDHFVIEQRPLLYRAADGLDPGGGARDLADSLYGELFGVRDRDGERQSLFRYFHGRSSLATWLRSILSQRYVDRWRANRRVDPIPDDESTVSAAAVQQTPDPDRPRYLQLIRVAMQAALARLAVRDRLRLACYYAQELTLAETAKLLGEHEATSSRHLARSRKAIRENVEHQLKVDHHLTDEQISECFASVMEDAGPLDLHELLGKTASEAERKELPVDRSS